MVTKLELMTDEFGVTAVSIVDGKKKIEAVTTKLAAAVAADPAKLANVDEPTKLANAAEPAKPAKPALAACTSTTVAKWKLTDGESRAATVFVFIGKKMTETATAAANSAKPPDLNSYANLQH